MSSNNSSKSLWRSIVDFFRARPGVPSAEEWNRRLLIEEAEKAAAAAGLTLRKKVKNPETENDLELKCIDEETDELEELKEHVDDRKIREKFD